MGRQFSDYHDEQMHSDPEYRAAWEAQEQEFCIAQALISARARAGMTQEDVAKTMGVSLSAVARMESGHVSLRSLVRYATATGQIITLSILPGHDEKGRPALP